MLCTNDSAIVPEVSLSPEVFREKLWEGINEEVARQAIGVYRIGSALIRLKATFPTNAEFLDHVAAKCNWQTQSVYNYMGVAARFEGREEDLRAVGYRLPASALYKISGTSVSEPIFEAIVAGAKERRITIAQVETLLSYSRLQGEIDRLDGGITPAKVLEAQRALPAAVRPLPTLAELLTLFATKGEVKPFGATGFDIERDGQMHRFLSLEDADREWRMSWERKPDAPKLNIQEGDLVRFRPEDLPCDDGDPICGPDDYCRVVGPPKLWKIYVQCPDDRGNAYGWAYRCGVVDVIRPEKPIPTAVVGEVEPFVKPFVKPAPVAVSDPIADRMPARSRPDWVQLRSLASRVVDGVPQLGAIAEFDAAGCVIDWPVEAVRYDWEELEIAVVNVTPHLQAMKVAHAALSTQLFFDLVQYTIEAVQQEEDYCRA